jgi:hypothetical protein
MARVSRSHVLVVDNLYHDERVEEAERVRDPTHVRNYTESEWRTFFEDAGLDVSAIELMTKPIEVEPWLERAGCEGEEAKRVRELLRDRVEEGWVALSRIAVKGLKGH